MSKFPPYLTQAAAASRPQPSFREVCIPLYLPAMEARELAAPHQLDLEDLVVDASGITVGGDEVDDDFY